MKTVAAATLIFSCLAAAAQTSGGFSELDAVLREASAVRLKTAREAEEWRAEKQRLESLAAVYKNMLKNLRAEAEKLEKRYAAVRASNDMLLAKIAADEAAVRNFSAFMDFSARQILSDKTAAALLKNFGFDYRSFAEKEISGKFRTLSAALEFLLSADSKTDGSCAGVFVKASVKPLSNGCGELEIDGRASK